MKIVIISDLHGNFDALEALPETYNELWVLGDLVNYGPEPAAVVDFVKANGSIVVRGNHDHSIGYDEDPHCSPRFRKMADVMSPGRFEERLLIFEEFANGGLHILNELVARAERQSLDLVLDLIMDSEGPRESGEEPEIKKFASDLSW